MASTKLIAEDEATGRIKEIYDEIMSQLGIDFVPNLYKRWLPTQTIWKQTGTESTRS